MTLLIRLLTKWYLQMKPLPYPWDIVSYIVTFGLILGLTWYLRRLSDPKPHYLYEEKK